MRALVDQPVDDHRVERGAPGDVPPPRALAGEDLTGFLPKQRPLPPGRHAAKLYLVMSAPHWNGRGTDTQHDLQAGDNLLTEATFTVRQR